MSSKYEPLSEYELFRSAPKSVFYSSRTHNKSRRLHSFKPATDTQQKLDNQRYRKERKK